MSSGCISVPSFEVVNCSVVQGPNPNPITAGIDLIDVVNAQWPFTSAQLNLEGIGSDGLTHADALCYLGPATAPYEYVDPVARKFSASSWSRAQTPTSTLTSDWWYYAIGLIASLVIVGGVVAISLRRRGRHEDGATADGEVD